MSNTQLLDASDIAAICGVDNKTIHNWTKKGMPHFRTPGRHLRFKPEEIVPWLAKFGYTIPETLRQYVIADTAQTRGAGTA